MEFQSEKTKIHLVQKRVRDFYRTILRNFIIKDHLDNTLITSINPSNPRNFIELNKIHFGAQVEIMLNEFNIDLNELNNFKIRCLDFYVELCIQIKKRFDFNNPVLEYASI